MKLRARWTGALPEVGDYLMSPIRPKFAYRIVRLSASDELADIARRVELEVEKVALRAVPDDAVVHNWKWDPRAKRNEAWHESARRRSE